ncbi:MAG TPA: gliding motility-associated C-terminal domain-containing protein, partial [Bacteroidia bacterium]|nr:gliding motility-associated C-terminal domain-containing protein [Bacteroidia bacterium]
TVFIHDITGHCPDTVAKTVVAASPPPLTTATSQLCGTTLAPALQVPSGGLGPYSWTMNGTTTVIGTSATLSYTPAVAPTDFFIVTYKDPTTGCEDSLKTTLNQVTIDFAASTSPACHGGNNGSITLNPVGTNTYTAFDWTVNGSLSHPTGTPNGGGPILYDSLLAGGTYTIVINPTGNSTCSFSLTANVSQGSLTVPPPVTVKGCPLDTIHVVPVVAPGSTHHWYQGTPTTPMPNPYFNASPLNLSGSYNVNNATYTDTVYSAAPNFCVSVYKITVKQQALNVSAPVQLEGIHCHDDSSGKVKITANSETNGPIGHQYSFTWTYPSPYTSPATTTAGIAPPQSSQYAGLHPGTYTITIKSGNCVATKTINLVNPAPLGPDTINTFYCPKDDSALIVATERGLAKYTWVKNHVAVPNYNNDSIWVPTGNVGNYEVAYLVGGCKDTGKVLITYPSWHALTPDTLVNVFTPNDDKKNDVFYPFYSRKHNEHDIDKQAEYYHIDIYDRWGKLVFQSDEYLQGWTGSNMSSHTSDDGTYYFIVKYKSNCSTKADIVTKRGYVQLLR